MNQEINRALNALNSISPDVGREEWVKICMAAKDAGLGFDDFDDWSAGGSTYNPHACRSTWNSAKPGKGVGEATLFYLAKTHGWSDSVKSSRPTAHRQIQAPVVSTPAYRPGMAPAEVWARCEAATIQHPYIVAKGAVGVPLDGLRVLPAGDTLPIGGERMAGALVVPVIRPDGSLASLQFIALPDVAARLKAKGRPGKLNLPGAPLEDGFFTVGELVPGGLTYIVEGIGAAWSCWQQTGAAAVVAFGAGRIRAVAVQLRGRDPAAQLVIVPDVGKEAAAADIAREVNAAVVNMPDGWPQNSDVNDLAQRDGGDALADLLDTAIFPATNNYYSDDFANKETDVYSPTAPLNNWKDILKQHVEKLNTNHAQVLIGGKHRILVERMSEGVLTTEFYPEIDYRKMHRHERIQSGTKEGNAVYKNPIDAWATHADCRRYKSVVFKPSATNESTATGDTYNTWKGFAVEPKRGNCEKVIQHIEKMACKGDVKLSEYFLNWIAYTLQYPDKPAGTAIVLRGEKGTGKGLLGTFLMSLWGGHGMHISNPKHMTGNFNAHLANTCFLFADEAFFSGDKSSEGTLKALITEKFMTVERKGIDAIQQKNYLKVFMATNSKWAVPASSDERRYFVSDMETRQDREYYVKLSAAMEDKTVQSAFLYAMLDRDITGFHTGDIPESEALKDQRLHSLDSAGKWMVDSISAGGFEAKGDRGEVYIEKWKEEIKAKTLFDSFIFWCDTQKVGEYGRMTRQGFGRRLNKWGFSGRKSDGNIVRHIMTLDKAKEAVESVESITIA